VEEVEEGGAVHGGRGPGRGARVGGEALSRGFPDFAFAKRLDCAILDEDGRTKDVARLEMGMCAHRPRAATTSVLFARGEAGVAVPVKRTVLWCAVVQRCSARLHPGDGRAVLGDARR